MTKQNLKMLVTPQDIEKAKQKARQLKKETGIKHTEALEQVMPKISGYHVTWKMFSDWAAETKPDYEALHNGIVIGIDMKDSMDYTDDHGEAVFKRGEFIHMLAAPILFNEFENRIVEECDEDQENLGKKYKDAYEENELKEWFSDYINGMEFFRPVRSLDLEEEYDFLCELIHQAFFFGPIIVMHQGKVVGPTTEKPFC